MITIKDLAKEMNVSYEAVRQQVKRYAKRELEGHVYATGKVQYLDDFAVEFLRAKRTLSPVVVSQGNSNEEIEHLQNANKKLLLEVDAAKDEVIALQKELLKNSNAVALLKAAEDQQAKLEKDLKEARQEAKEADRERRESEDRAWKRERELENKAADLQKQLDRLAVAGFWERRKILKELKRKK